MPPTCTVRQLTSARRSSTDVPWRFLTDLRKANCPSSASSSAAPPSWPWEPGSFSRCYKSEGRSLHTLLRPVGSTWTLSSPEEADRASSLLRRPPTKLNSLLKLTSLDPSWSDWRWPARIAGTQCSGFSVQHSPQNRNRLFRITFGPEPPLALELTCSTRCIDLSINFVQLL